MEMDTSATMLDFAFEEEEFWSCSASKLGVGLDDLIFKSPSITMTPKRKRKRHRTDDLEGDTVSLQSLDMNIEEPKRRRRSSLAKMSSLTNLLSPVNISKHGKKVGQALQKSFSLKNLMSPMSKKQQYQITPYKKPAPTPPKRRLSCYWHETIDSQCVAKNNFNAKQIEWQESIFELYKSEEDLIEDLNMVKITYHDSMSKLRLLTVKELNQIFGPIDTLVPLHQELVEQLRDQRQPDGTTHQIGQVLLDWVSKLDCYIPYCSNQIYAKALLDLKKLDPAVEDFLERCLESPFSRKLDLWSFLDVPRSRLVKYPLLFKNIQKLSPPGHEDRDLLEQCIHIVDGIIAKVDSMTGEAKCRFTREKLEYLDDKQKCPLIEESKVILCDGTLKNSRGTKLHVVLFEKVLVLTRPATRGQQFKYQVYRQPIPVSCMELEDLQDGQAKKGSFRSHFSQDQKLRHTFKVSCEETDTCKGQSHTLQANDEHDKRQWISCLQTVVPTRLEAREEADGAEATSGSPRSSSSSEQERVTDSDEDAKSIYSVSSLGDSPKEKSTSEGSD